jgi:peptidoglycan/LPS O-acetylase OafA/YrhL
MTAAWVYVALKRRGADELVRRRAGIVQIVSLVALVAISYKFGGYSVNKNPILGLIAARRDIALHMAMAAAMAAFMLSTCLVAARRQMPFALPAARQLGDISYGMYLIHLPILMLISSWVGDTGIGGWLDRYVLLLAVGMPLVVLYAYASARWFEQPIRRWARRYGRRAQVNPASPQPVPPT